MKISAEHILGKHRFYLKTIVNSDTLDGAELPPGFHLNGHVCTLTSFYMTSPIVLVAFLSVFLIHSTRRKDIKNKLAYRPNADIGDIVDIRSYLY